MAIVTVEEELAKFPPAPVRRVSILYSMKTGSGVQELDTLDIDATISLTHGLTAEVTQHPIESGATVSDHVLVRPDSVKLEGIISNAPIRTGLRNAPSEEEFKEQTKAGAYANRAELVRDVLEAIWRSRESVKIDAGKVYEDMVLNALEFPEDASLGDAVRFSATFLRVRYVESRVVAMPKTDKPKERSHGKRPTEKATAPTSARAKSTVLQMAEGLQQKVSLMPAP